MKKQSVLMKQAVAPLQATEVGIIRRKLATFDVSPLVPLVCSYIHSCAFLGYLLIPLGIQELETFDYQFQCVCIYSKRNGICASFRFSEFVAFFDGAFDYIMRTYT